MSCFCCNIFLFSPGSSVEVTGTTICYYKVSGDLTYDEGINACNLYSSADTLASVTGMSFQTTVQLVAGSER